MVDSQVVNHDIHIYTVGVRWQGRLVLPISRRISDFLNDTLINYCIFDHLVPDSPGSQLSTQMNLPMDQVAMLKSNLIALSTSKSTSPPPVVSFDRIAKEVKGIKIIIPPLVIFGNLHLMRGVEWFHVLNLPNQKFLSLTDATISCLDLDLPLDDQADFVTVNCQRIVAASLLHSTA